MIDRSAFRYIYYRIRDFDVFDCSDEALGDHCDFLRNALLRLQHNGHKESGLYILYVRSSLDFCLRALEKREGSCKSASEEEGCLC